MKTKSFIAAALFLCVSCATGTIQKDNDPSVSQTGIEIRFIEKGSTDAEKSFSIRGSGEEVFLDESMLFDTGDFESAELMTNDTGIGTLVLSLNGDAAERYSHLTNTSAGRRIAVIINGEIVYALKPGTQTDGKIYIPGILTKEEAAAVVKTISDRTK
jgi:preprotein translocase subunit SecD